MSKNPKGALLAVGALLTPLIAFLLGFLLLVSVIQPEEEIEATAGREICGTGKLTVPDKAKPWMAEAAKTSGLPEGYLAAIAKQESAFNPAAFASDSNGGTWGLFQINRAIWHETYPQGDNPGGAPKGITDPMVHAHYGGLYLKKRLAGVKALQKSHPQAAFAKLKPEDALVIAHNAGEGNLMKYPNIPSITKGYLENVHQSFAGGSCPGASSGTAQTGTSGKTGKDDYSPFMVSHGFTPGSPAYVVDIYSFYYGECTGYAAFAVAHYSKYRDFKNNWRNNSHFGHAKEWVAGARQAGIAADGTPAVGAVAVSLTDGSVGHVAYVTEVRSDGTFAINESNFSAKHTFGSRTGLRPGQEFQYFLHFEK